MQISRVSGINSKNKIQKSQSFEAKLIFDEIMPGLSPEASLKALLNHLSEKARAKATINLTEKSIESPSYKDILKLYTFSLFNGDKVKLIP